MLTLVIIEGKIKNMNYLNQNQNQKDETNKIASMTSVVIKKEKLLEILKENKAKHDEIVKDAMVGYWALAAEKLKTKTEEFNKAVDEIKVDFAHIINKLQSKLDAKEQLDDHLILQLTFKYNKQLDLKYPEDHSEEYDEAIRLVELSVYDEVRLNSGEFKQYVLNKWDWRENFVLSNVGYVTSTGLLSGVSPEVQSRKLKNF